MSDYARTVDFSNVRIVVGNSQRIGDLLLKCELCNIAFKDSLALMQHVSSDAHRLNVGKKAESPATVEAIREFFKTRTDLSDSPTSAVPTQLYDAHCHFSSFFVENWFCPEHCYLLNATDPSQFPELVVFQRKYPRSVRIGYGAHPYYLHMCPDVPTTLEQIRERLLADSQAFVGEIGLDTRPAALADASLDTQLQYFTPQLDIAFELNRDCNIHIISRRPGLWPTFIKCLSDAATKYRQYNRSIIMHSYNGTFTTFQQLRDAISGCQGRVLLSVSHFTDTNKNARACIRKLDSNLLLLETDWYRENEDNWNNAMNTAISVVMQEKSMTREDVLSSIRDNWWQYNLLPS